jgi:energy-coupling factor transport system ATP-binding protein
VRGEVLELLAALAQERAVLVVTHEPELFRGVIAGGWRLETGQLTALQTGPQTTPETGLLTRPLHRNDES